MSQAAFRSIEPALLCAAVVVVDHPGVTLGWQPYEEHECRRDRNHPPHQQSLGQHQSGYSTTRPSARYCARPFRNSTSTLHTTVGSGPTGGAHHTVVAVRERDPKGSLLSGGNREIVGNWSSGWSGWVEIRVGRPRGHRSPATGPGCDTCTNRPSATSTSVSSRSAPTLATSGSSACAAHRVA